ncbi:MAG: SDR family NAD(P)-dependent oxidoreductase, partial [Erysipelotrichaceae bacterium]|nr:SDR family NAD(P)-dependent oxidoreductase [Erysipelotrichaceae bacterium]
MIPFQTLNSVDLSSSTILITGANSGLGYEASRFFAKRGAHVILCSRSNEKGLNAKSRILAQSPQAKISVELLDLADFASINELAQRVRENYPQIDILINNAGIMAVPY